MAFKFDISSGEEILLKAAAIGAALLGVVSVYNFYINNIWQPKVEIIDIDYKDGIANLLIGGKPFTLRGDSSYLINNDWGIKFGFTPKASGKRVYDRIELLKRNMVQKVLDKSKETNMLAFTGFNEQTFFNDAFDGGKGVLVAKTKVAFTGNEDALVNDVYGVKEGDGFSIFNNK